LKLFSASVESVSYLAGQVLIVAARYVSIAVAEASEIFWGAKSLGCQNVLL